MGVWQSIFSSSVVSPTGNNDLFQVAFTSSDQLDLGTWTTRWRQSNALFRDSSSW
jgi:hypothetical protein